MLRPLLLLLAVGTAHAQTFTDRSDLVPTEQATYGAAFADADGDGRTDLVATDLLLLQRASGFEAVSLDVDGTGLPLGAILGDVDGDGRPEALVLDADRPNVYRYAPAREALAPIPGGGITLGSGFSLTQGSLLFDYDRDGALDVLIGNDGGIDLLFRGLGNGTFETVSDLLPQILRGDYGMAAADYDRDGDDDVYVGLCFGVTENLLYRNDGDAFLDAAAAAGVDDPRASWGVIWFDYDNDGWLDLFVANMPLDGPGTNGLFRNDGDGTFTDRTDEAGVAGSPDDTSWSATAADFDNDGWTDLFVANDPEPAVLYRNDGDGTFTPIAAGLPTLVTRSVAAGDANRDGWPDLFTPGTDGSDHKLFYNDGGANGWLTVRLRGVASNPDGVGARVEVTAGSLSMVREVTAGDGFMSQSHGLTAHFGLGDAATADVTVRWPNGQVDTYAGVAASQPLTLVEGVGENAPPEPFALLSPPDGASVEGTATLSWEAAADADAVGYTVHLSGPNGDRTFETNQTLFTLPPGSLDALGEYRWAVVARDAYSTRTSLDPFGFTNLVVPIEPGAPPLQALTVEPNPARETATVRFSLARPETLTLEVTDALGRRVRRADLGLRSAGEHAIPVSLAGLGAGVYLVRLRGERSAPAVRRVTVAR